MYAAIAARPGPDNLIRLSSMSQDSSQQLHKDITCPFCGLLCDDIDVQCQGQQLQVRSNACAGARRRFEAALPASCPATVAGREVSLEEAVAEAGRLLGEARAPLFAGLGTDVAGMRALMALAESCGATLDHIHSEALHRNNLVLQELGWLNATLSEVRNRADLLLFVGTDARHFPRFHERVLSQPSQFGAWPRGRTLIYLGEDLQAPEEPGMQGQHVQLLPCRQVDLAEQLSVLRALLAGQPLAAGADDGAMARLREALLAARYGVVVWSAGDLDFPQAALTVQGICELVKEVNLHGTRCAGFPLGGTDGAGTANSVCGWQSGYPLRVSYRQGFPRYDIPARGFQELLASQDADCADCLLWVSSFSSEKLPPETGLPTISLCRPEAAGQGRTPEVFLPVGTPGVDHAGQMFRTDGVVSLPLQQLRSTPWPAVSEVVRQIAGQYQAQGKERAAGPLPS